MNSGRLVTIREDWAGSSGLGGSIWDSAVIISNFIDSRQRFPEGDFKGKKVLELGSGCGLVGIYAAILGANVYFTDMNIVFDQLQLNIDNNLSIEERKNIEVEELVWGTKGHLEKPWPQFDYMFAAECLYHEDTVIPFLETTYQLANNNTIIYLSGIIGERTITLFHKIVGRYFICCIVKQGDNTEHPNIADRDGRKLFVLKKKSEKNEM